MDAFSEFAMKSDDVLRVELEQLLLQHRELDEEIKVLEEEAAHDQLAIRRLKRQKLYLKDIITYIQNRLLPDIIA